jgi:septum formation protein
VSDSPAAPVDLVLASASPTRALLLRHAGLTVVVDPAAVDEAAAKESLRAAGADAGAAAIALAELKAQKVSRRHAGGLVLGADQLLECDGDWFDKPADLAAARSQLQALRGRRHRLYSAAVAVRDGIRLWHHVGEASLTMRPFGDAFLDAYLKRAGADLLGSVGAYRLEGLGVQLFATVQGDHFTILGLPLLPLLDFLRGHRVLAA